MMDFITNNISFIIGAIVGLFIVLFIYRAINLISKAKKIDSDGIETDAIVTKVVDTSDPDDASPSYVTYVEYKDDYGQIIESPLSLTNHVEYNKGDKVRIKYIPGIKDIVRKAH